MNRRGFLQRMMGGLAAALVAHESLGQLVPIPKEPELSVPIRIVRAYDLNADGLPARLDALYGWGALHADCAVRIVC